MEMIAFILVGFATGLLCRFIIPNPRLGGWRLPLIGMVGGCFGGLVVGSLQTGTKTMVIAAPSLIGCFLGSLVAIAVVTILTWNRAHV